MHWQEQGAAGGYTASPRTLTFLLRGDQVLLLRGAPGKARWAGRLNGIGGRLAPKEGVLAGALREVREETGYDLQDLALRGVVHSSPPNAADPGVLLFVFLGAAPEEAAAASAEGELAWYPVDALPTPDVLDDVPLLLPRLLAADQRGALVYGHYVPAADGTLRYAFTEAPAPPGGRGTGASASRHGCATML
jgi:8-oxo-dGTP diphosphatase